jgi:hypothetical protein
MTVFNSSITLFVILAALEGPHANARAWTFPIAPPDAPTINRVKSLTNPSMTQIQNAIAPRTRIDIIGTVDASSGQTLWIDVDDVRLNFKRASIINWSGGDTWNGFLGISGHRIQVMNLRMNVQGNGRCRGVQLYTPASDVRISGSRFQNVADGLVADGEFERIELYNTKFLECSDWKSTSMDGGCGIFMEDDDWNPDHVRLNKVTVTLSSQSAQHGIRISQVEQMVVENSYVRANAKRSLWAYGVDHFAARHSTFDRGSVLFNLKPHELMTERPTQYVRMDSCTINHETILVPLAIYCGKGTNNVRMKDIDINSTSSSKALSVEWRSDDLSNVIRWYDGSLTFNGQTMSGMQCCSINDWTPQEQDALYIGPRDDPRN